MAENINGSNPLSSGGHRWRWSQRAQLAKRLGSVGVTGEGRMVMANGARPGSVEGDSGGPALLIASSTTRALADTAMNALEQTLVDLQESGAAVAWEDDMAHTGSALVVEEYQPVGPRVYGMSGANFVAWQFYKLQVLDLAGAW